MMNIIAYLSRASVTKKEMFNNIDDSPSSPVGEIPHPESIVTGKIFFHGPNQGVLSQREGSVQLASLF